MNRGGIFLLVLAISFLLSGVVLMWRGYRMRQVWQPVEARVVAADIANYRSGSRQMYRGWVEFRYFVHGQRYEVPQSLSHSSSDHASVRAEIDRYAPQSRHRVYFNPEAPADMLMDISSTWRFFLIPALFSVVGVVLAVAWIAVFGRFELHYCPMCATRTGKLDRFCHQCAAGLPRRVHRSLRR